MMTIDYETALKKCVLRYLIDAQAPRSYHEIEAEIIRKSYSTTPFPYIIADLEKNGYIAADLRGRWSATQNGRVFYCSIVGGERQ